MLRESQKKAVKKPMKPKLLVPPSARRIIPDDGERVHICCKFPMGLRLRIFELVETEEHGPSGTRTVKMARQIGGPDNCVVIRGYNRDGIHFQGGLVNPDYAVTKNVPAAFWKLWLEQNADSDLVLNHLIWAHRQEASVVSFVREHESNLSGLEPMQPTPPGAKATDPRIRGMKMAPTSADVNE